MNNDNILKEIMDIHASCPLAGIGEKNLLSLPENTIKYVLYVLRDETSCLPALETEEWRSLLQYLEPQLITPYLFIKISNLPPSSQPPKEIMDKMRMKYLESGARSLKMGQQLKNILKEFEKEGILCLVMKGQATRYTTYENPALRPANDIDILVKPENVRKARKALQNMGYICLEKFFEISKKAYWEELFMPDKGTKWDYMVEIHWQLIPYHMANRNIGLEKIFLNKVKVDAEGFSFHSLNTIDQIIHTSMHMIYGHGGDIRLNWIIDMALLSKQLKSQQEWEELIKRSVDFGARLSLEKALKMAILWTGLKIPYGYDDFTKWPAPTENEAIIFSHISKGNTTNKIKLIIPESAGLWEKTRIIFKFAIPAPGIIRLMGSEKKDSILPLLYIRRWIRLIKKL